MNVTPSRTPIALSPHWSVVALGAAITIGSIGRIYGSDRPISIRELREGGTSHGSTVVVEGTVIPRFIQEGKGVILHDGTAGIWCSAAPDGEGPLRGGQRYRIEARILEGSVARSLDPIHTERMGDGRLPNPISVDGVALATGQYDCAFVALQGTVRSITESIVFQGDVHWLELMTARGIVAVGVDRSIDVPGSVEIADEIRVVGTVVTLANPGYFASTFVQAIPDEGTIEVIRSGGGDDVLNERPIPIADLRKGAAAIQGQRVHVMGTVTASFGRGRIFLQDASGAIGATGFDPRGKITVGDRVSVAGFLGRSTSGRGAYQIALASALFSHRGSDSSPIEPTPLRERHFPAGEQLSSLVSVTGKVVSVELPGERSFALEQIGRDGNSIRLIAADFSHAPPDANLPRIRPGASVTIAGILSADSKAHPGRGEQAVLSDWTVTARGTGDLEILSPAPPTPAEIQYRRTVWTLSSMLTIAIAAAGYLLTRMLREKRRSAIRSAIHRERSRIAQDLHDSLAHSLTVTAIRLNAADQQAQENPAEAREHLAHARTEVDESLAKTGALIEGIVYEEPIHQTIVERLQDLARRLSTHGGPEIGIQADLPQKTVAPTTSDTVFLIAREALTNVVRHAQATVATVRISSLDRGARIELVIEDDGTGFSLATAAPAGASGLATMPARADLAGGTFEIDSQADRGTRISVRLPLE